MAVQGTYYEAVCQSIDPVAKTVTAAFPESSELDSGSFTLSYDVLVLGAHPTQLCHLPVPTGQLVQQTPCDRGAEGQTACSRPVPPTVGHPGAHPDATAACVLGARLTRRDSVSPAP